MKYRKLNKLIAKLNGYFWLPCIVCGQMFGGHEWGDGDYSSIQKDDMGIRQGICPDCEKQWEDTAS